MEASTVTTECGCVYDAITGRRVKKCRLIERLPDAVIAYYEPKPKS